MGRLNVERKKKVKEMKLGCWKDGQCYVGGWEKKIKLAFRDFFSTFFFPSFFSFIYFHQNEFHLHFFPYLQIVSEKKFSLHIIFIFYLFIYFFFLVWNKTYQLFGNFYSRFSVSTLFSTFLLTTILSSYFFFSQYIKEKRRKITFECNSRKNGKKI